MRKKEQLIDHGLIKLFLFALVMLTPFNAWADYYDIAIQYGTEESNFHSVLVTGNPTNILGDGTMSYDQENNVLTLKGVDLTCSYGSAAFISHNGYMDAEQVVTVRLEGSNTVTLGNNSYFFEGKQITFTAADNDASLNIVTQDGREIGIFSGRATITYNDNLSFFSSTSEIKYAEPYLLWIGGTQVTTANAANVLGDDETPTVVYDAENHKLTLNGASVGQITYSGTSNLTIAFGGTCSITTEDTNDAIQYVGSESTRPKLNFSLTNESTTGTLTINGGNNSVIYGFSDVTFDDGLNLASTSAQGVYYDNTDDGYLMRGHDTTPRDLTITTATYYPIWIYDPSLSQTGYCHTQLSGESTIEIGEGTVSFDGEHTITISNINFNYDSNTMIVVGPSMDKLTINLVGTSSAGESTVLGLWDTTPLTFTTSESTPGSLTGYDIVSWKNFGNGQISYQNGLKVFYDVENSYKKTISTTGTYFKIGNTEVSTTRDITTSEGTAHFDASSNTLTLTGATLGEQGAAASTDIQVLVDDLIIEISGTNSTNRIYGNITYSGSNYQSSNIQINKASNVESASLKVTNVEGFTSCTWGDGLYLSAQDAQGATVDVHYEHYEGEGGSMQSYYGEIAEVTFSTTQPSNTIWVNGISPNADGNFIDPTTNQPTGGLSFNASKSTLTLTNASISTNDNNPSPIIVCNGDLTVNLVGEDNNVYFNGYYGTYTFKNNASTGTLTFTGEGSLHINSDYKEGTYFGLCDGFSTVDFGDLAYTINGDSKKISPLNISTPMMNVYEGKIDFTTEGYLFGSTTYYKIVYADGSGNEEEVPLTNVVSNQTFDFNNYNEKITISELTGPCTVYAYTKYKTETGNSAKAKLFVFNDKKIALNSNTELTADMLDIQPAIEENDGVNLTIVKSYNPDAIEYSEDTGKATIVGIGSCNLDVKMTLSDTPQVTVLNMNGEVAMFSTEVTVVPAAPTIVKDPEKTYLDTDKITINLPEGEIYENCNIFYTWDEEVEVEAYALFNESETVIKKYTSPIPALTGTLRAWVGYPYGDDYYYYGIEATPQDFEVIPSIANAVVVGLENKTYTGAAITPSFAVKASAEAEDNLTEGTDYEVSYEVAPVVQPQGAPSRRAPESVEIKNAGLYIIVITGKGAYGGTKTVPFTVNKADLADVTIEAIADQIYTGEDLTPTLTITFNENAVAATEYSVSYTKEGTATQSIVNPGQYTVTLTSTNKNFTENSTKSATFNILRDLGITFEGTNLWASYYATENLAVPEGLTAYVVSNVNETSGEVTVAPVDYLPKDNAVLLERASGASASGYVAAQYTGTTDEVTNMLEGRVDSKAVSEIEGTVYVLYNNVFKRTTSGTIPARRGYLILNAPESPTLNIVFDTTVIGTLAVGPDTDTDNWYTIDGLKLNGKPQREGLYINNGKKVFIKK